MFYINLISKQYIDESAIVKETDNGLVYYENGCWKFLPPDKYEKTYADTKTFTTVVSSTGEAVNTVAKADADRTKRHIFYTNYFGLSKLDLSLKKYRSDSGIMTGDMSVISYRPLKLLAEVKAPDKTSVEFSIIDGSEEHYILPQGEDNVVNEKVFLGVEPRFKSEKYSYFKDFTSLGEKIPDGDMELGSSLYTVSYKPTADAYTYTPKHSSIKVKVVLRMYDDTAEPPEVNSIVLSQEA